MAAPAERGASRVRFWRSQRGELFVRVYLSVAVGGALGCISRYFVTMLVQQRAGSGFPVATLLINVTGSLLLGFLMRYALQSAVIGPESRAMLTTGFCGGYTTFSTFSYETALL